MEDEDSGRRVTVVNDRAQGGASIKDGSLELMLHHRLLDDDAFGVQEALNETEFDQGLVARGSHYIQFDDNPEDAIERTRILANEIFAEPIIGFARDPESAANNDLKPVGSYQLPVNVNLLTLSLITETNQVRKSGKSSLDCRST